MRAVALGEFALIDRYFRDCGVRRADVALGIGDDAALLDCAPGMQLVAAVDTLVEGVHFLPGAPAESVGHRALAVNLSDLGAMGASPAWALLALTLPAPDEGWLAGFVRGFARLAREHGVELAGGDTTAGPLCVTVQVLGFVPRGAALERRAGRPGDLLFVSGTPGDAAAGLMLDQGRLAAAPEDAAWLRDRFRFPTPRVALGERLRGLARACIDVSDGLAADAGKLAAASGCGVEIDAGALPLSDSLVRAVGATRARELALAGGDDYELCFAVRQEDVPRLERELPPERWSYRRIGVLVPSPGVRVFADGAVTDFSHSGFDHFAGAADDQT